MLRMKKISGCIQTWSKIERLPYAIEIRRYQGVFFDQKEKSNAT